MYNVICDYCKNGYHNKCNGVVYYSNRPSNHCSCGCKSNINEINKMNSEIFDWSNYILPRDEEITGSD